MLGGTSVPQLRNVFRDDKGDWKSGSVYVWIVSDQNINLFHGANLSLEHRFANFDRVDKNGKRFVEELVKGARENEGGQFLQYFYDNPNNPNDGDEEAKLGYAYSFELYEGQGKFVIGSGIYTGDLDD
ncbi:MAG: cache domain-containing protein [Flavobacteriaceae bacterium]|nr:cache domain-containing protein [Flavobacteriaceae bacterium]MCY4216380.1 cache domain-containing protein [Flavobacteriaceae bacterium]MCY4254265.1 cache domain-containing protein [Flavobacteriaceae bacterium]